ncbi:MAG: DUF2934 domain-containing protein [Verrucomicrobium sp.]|nr:DUF2934 domain-containing protein [Verrucomicrobium sp.]
MIPSKEAIAERAYELWVEAGSPPGRAQEFWLKAEEDLESREFDQDHPRRTPLPRHADVSLYN